MSACLGFWSATALSLVGIAYAVVVGVGIAQVGFTDPIRDPLLLVMEVLTLASAPLVVCVTAAIQGCAADDRRTTALIAFGFGLLMAGTTSAVHFVGLTVGRQTGEGLLVWPSVPYALEMLAWDVFLGLALIFAAPVFRRSGLEGAARYGLGGVGLLCLLGATGPAVGDMALQRIGILGYGVGLPVVSLVVAMVFRRRMSG